MPWQNDLGALVQEPMALAQSIRSQFPASGPTVKSVLVIVEQTPVEPPAKATIAPMAWPVSEREEIKQRVANFKAHQLKNPSRARRLFFETMSRTRGIETTRHLVRKEKG
jgi:hypothetical protein